MSSTGTVMLLLVVILFGLINMKKTLFAVENENVNLYSMSVTKLV